MAATSSGFVWMTGPPQPRVGAQGMAGVVPLGDPLSAGANQARGTHEDRRVETEAAENAEPGVAADGVPQQDDAEEWMTTSAAARFTVADS